MKLTSIFRIGSLLLALPVLLSCHKDPEGEGADPEKGYATGHVVDTNGKPLANVEILLDNTLIFNSYISGKTNANGDFKVKLTTGSWMPYATLEKEYNGKTYEVRLHPDNNSGFSIDGGVCNFTWKLTGARKSPMTGTYGGNIILTRGIGSDLYDSENIEYTFTPVGTLIDGSTGQVLKLHEVANTSYLRDIPIGRYTVTAVYKLGAVTKSVLLRNRYANGQFASSIQMDFEPESPDGNNMAAIDYKEGQ
ncbi:Ig-like domain-containing protein [Paraflavitalea sp. CAU 1676]|uniref:Ig-like domain-containing protein n=1 Tax=Paraflavitalea sp. CAU 1676 TaxID=3032598 RepID=UPI0023DA22C1|nr:Ig-like domain-containing protein [Paraflavitalea sp. CAU 1676]MDF2193279.1 Ig-like domain-containing protein [Paraflavitalea sp. CAU 1676]